MDNTKVLILIVGMALVTYIPRAIPAVLIDKMQFGAKTEKFLKLIPYTAMSALIFPGIFTVDNQSGYRYRWRSCSRSIGLEKMPGDDMCAGSNCSGLFTVYHSAVKNWCF